MLGAREADPRRAPSLEAVACREGHARSDQDAEALRDAVLRVRLDAECLGRRLLEADRGGRRRHVLRREDDVLRRGLVTHDARGLSDRPRSAASERREAGGGDKKACATFGSACLVSREACASGHVLAAAARRPPPSRAAVSKGFAPLVNDRSRRTREIENRTARGRAMLNVSTSATEGEAHVRSQVVAAVVAAGLLGGRAARAEDACAADVKQFCGDVQLGGGRLHDCLKKNEANLSAPCNARLATNEAKFRALVEQFGAACSNAAARLCAEVKPGRGRVVACLMRQQDDLSSGCRAETDRFQEATE